jgi:DNA-binding transcriptional MerR regulator
VYARGVRLTVKQVADRVGTPSRTVRYYDSIGLVRADDRSATGYRLYGPEEEGRLLFVRRAKRLGFSLDEIRALLAAAQGGCGATEPELERLLEQKVEEIDARIAELAAFRDRLIDYRAGKHLSARNRCGHGTFCGCLDDVPQPWAGSILEVI